MISLEKFERIRLGHFPTPLEPLTRLSQALDGPEIWVKREDCTGLGLGGNKVRKLEYLLGEAIARRADTVITTRGPQSNHARQTAAAAARCGLNCILVLVDAVPDRAEAYYRNGNLILDRLFGAEIQVEPAGADVAEALARAAEHCSAQGHRPYVIPSGGSTATGVLGHVAAATELIAQWKESGLVPTHVALASGSGGTHAGLVLGLELCGFAGSVVGYCVSRSAREQCSKVSALIEQVCAKLDVAPPFQRSDLVFEEGVLGAGYGQPTVAMRDAVSMVAALEGIVLDPVYTGKAMAGLIGAIRTGRFDRTDRVVFIHSGGAPSLFAYPDVFGGPVL